jgi:hypothetical protein
MSYPASCLSKHVGLRGQCTDPDTEPAFFLDDIAGVDITKLAQLATTEKPTGADMGLKLIESASRIMIADVEAIYDGRYKVQNTLVAGCSICTYGPTYASGPGKGTMVKNNSFSNYAQTVIDKFEAKINATGTFTVVITDDTGTNDKLITHDFEAQTVYDFREVGYKTKQPRARIYMLEDDVPLAKLTCPSTGSGCGCSGRRNHVDTTLVYTGTADGLETQQAYGFRPCAYVSCDPSDLLCFIANSAPNMMGLALLYKAAELYWNERLASDRNNKIAGTNTEYVTEQAKKYAKLYLDKLNGTNTRGLKDIVYTTLQEVNDACVVCNSLLGVAWAAG